MKPKQKWGATMADEGFKRKLAAILSADVEGYSRLMDDDEEATVRTLYAYRTAINDLVQQYRGRVVDTPGDNILAEFNSVVDAVNCAVEIQRELAERNAVLPENRRMQFRIGVNLGDVIEEEGRIYGDGVNIAARVEAMAEAGGICISGRAYDQVANKLGLEYENLGEHQVKNITTPIRVFRVLSLPGAAVHRVVRAKKAVEKKWRNLTVAAGSVVLIVAVAVAVWQFYMRPPSVEPASKEKMVFPLPEKPSIAVLPFINMSGDPEQSYFSDGITEHIITSLSKVPYIFVIARNSTFAFKGKSVKIQQIAEELAVRYVLEGSVQRSDDRVRITVQLIDATTGHHLWAENYDRKSTDIFALQDEIAMKIMAELQVELTAADLGRFSSIKTTNLKAYEKYLKGMEHHWRRTEADLLETRNFAKEAIALDPEYGAAYLLLTGPSDDTHRLLSCVYLLRRQYEKAIVEVQKAVELTPNSANSNFIYGLVLRNAERYDEAILVLKKAIRLNPVTPINYLNNLAWSYTFSEQYEKAIPLWNRAIKRNPDYLFAYMGLTCAYQLSGDAAKARKAATEVLRIKPNLSMEVLEKRPFSKKNEELQGRMFEAFRKAGIPEHSSRKASD